MYVISNRPYYHQREITKKNHFYNQWLTIGRRKTRVMHPPKRTKMRKKCAVMLRPNKKQIHNLLKFFGTCFIMSLYQHAQLAAILNVNLLYAWHMDGLFQVFVF